MAEYETEKRTIITRLRCKSDLSNIITVLKKDGLQIQATHTPFYSIPFQLVLWIMTRAYTLKFNGIKLKREAYTIQQ